MKTVFIALVLIASAATAQAKCEHHTVQYTGEIGDVGNGLIVLDDDSEWITDSYDVNWIQTWKEGDKVLLCGHDKIVYQLFGTTIKVQESGR